MSYQRTATAFPNLFKIVEEALVIYWQKKTDICPTYSEKHIFPCDPTMGALWTRKAQNGRFWKKCKLWHWGRDRERARAM